jgi:hypothetical protein
VVREALTKDYAAMAYDQPYQRALYSGSQLQEARKWHVDEYSALIGGLAAADLQVRSPNHKLHRRLAAMDCIVVFGWVLPQTLLALQQMIVLSTPSRVRNAIIGQEADSYAIRLQAFVPKLLGRMHVTAYVTGNISVGAAADLARHVQELLSDQLKTLPPFPSQVLDLRSQDLPK